jgi:hypothetical protein
MMGRPIPGDVMPFRPSGAQIRAARDLLGWDVRGLAHRSIVSIRAVHAIESSHGTPSSSAKQLAVLQATLEAAGIEFLNGNAPGVRLHTNIGKRNR